MRSRTDVGCSVKVELGWGCSVRVEWVQRSRLVAATVVVVSGRLEKSVGCCDSGSC